MNNLIKKLSVILFVASVIGLVVSTLGMYDDVMSTAHTLQNYFPATFGVTPSSTENGNIRLGVFITAIQIVAAAIVISEHFSKKYRILAGVLLALSVVFDAWTDIVYRSGYLTGNITVAATTTIAFYTFGTEILNGFSIALLSLTWRQAIADIAWNFAYMLNSLSTVSGEFRSFWSAAKRRAASESQRRVSEKGASMGFYNNSGSNNSRQPIRRQEPTYSSTYQQQRATASQQSMLSKLGLKPASSLVNQDIKDIEEPEYEDLV